MFTEHTILSGNLTLKCRHVIAAQYQKHLTVIAILCDCACNYGTKLLVSQASISVITPLYTFPFLQRIAAPTV